MIYLASCIIVLMFGIPLALSMLYWIAEQYSFHSAIKEIRRQAIAERYAKRQASLRRRETSLDAADIAEADAWRARRAERRAS